MDLDFNDEQEMLRETLRRLCTEHAPLEVVRAMEDDPTGYPDQFWKQLAALGVLGLTFPEQYGGAGQSTLEGAIVYEELGRSLAPSPHFVSSVMSAGVLAHGGGDEQKQTWLPALASGESIITPAWLEPKHGFGSSGVQLRAVSNGGDYRLTGTKRHVLFARTATRLLVLARTGDAPHDVDLFLVDRADPGVELIQEKSLASDTQYRVVFDNVRVSTADRIGEARSGWGAWSEVTYDGMILLAAQAIGGAERALEMTVQYAREREQFDKPLAAFQAIAHYLADAATVVDGGRTLVHEAAWARSVGKPVVRLAPMAKLFACQTFRDVTAMAQQVHGGIGFTIDYPIQLYFRRAKQLQLAWWDSRYLEELIARDVLDAGEPRA